MVAFLPSLPDFPHLGLFLAAALALLLIPGPAVLFIVTRSVAQGRRAGLISVLGIHAATLVHVGAAALGLSALLATSALAFGIVKYAGAAYLIWLGVRKLSAPSATTAPPSPPDRHARLFRDGFVVNLLNPKTALFFLAFLPQFVVPAHGGVAGQIVVLGLIFIALGLVTDCAYALAAGTLGAAVQRNPAFLRVERYLTGSLLIGLGVTAAVAGGRRR